MTPEFDSSFALVVLFYWFAIVLLVYGLIKLPGLIRRYINGPPQHNENNTHHSIKNSVLIGIVAGLAPVLILVLLILNSN